MFDASWLAYRARYSMRDLCHEDMPTGVLFGFLEQMLATCQDPKVLSNKVAVFFDSKKSHRKREFPDYKKKRQEKTPEEWEELKIMHSQLEILRTEILPAIGFPVYRQTGFESDDLIATAAEYISTEGRNKRAIIISSDGDLYQCITDSVHFYNPMTGKYFDPTDFLESKGIVPEMWGEVKALAGCTSDSVPGIRGVGEITACKYLLNELNGGKKRDAIESE